MIDQEAVHNFKVHCLHMEVRLIEHWQRPQRLGNTYRRAIVSRLRAVVSDLKVVVGLVVVHRHQSSLAPPSFQGGLVIRWGLDETTKGLGLLALTP